MIKFRSIAVSEHPEVPLADNGQWEELTAAWRARAAVPATERRKAYVASVGPHRDAAIAAAQSAEIVSLVRAQGTDVVGAESLVVVRARPATLLGLGTLTALATRARACGATMLVLDAELTPSQARNVEDAIGLPVCDREAIILNVFAGQARTRRARIQVELARLRYLRPRIRGVGIDMDQQMGGAPGARGPGETASELLARKLDGRLRELEKVARRLTTAAATQRGPRASAKAIALVGYTNAGKTSLMNALTGAALPVRDAPFETLDTTARALSRHGQSVVVSDTVGFIRRLPVGLLPSFESTFAELVEASLVCVVVDVSDPEAMLHLATTHALIERVGASALPRFYVWTKRDRVTDVGVVDGLARAVAPAPSSALSTHDEAAVRALGDALLDAVRGADESLVVRVPYGDREALGWVYGQCRVVRSEAEPEGVRFALTGPATVLARLRARHGVAR